jgi:hypothetical protein
MSEFWDKLTQGFEGRVSTSLDSYLGGRDLEGDHFNSVRLLSDTGRSKAALELPIKAGTRVTFMNNLGSLLSYENPPNHKMEGSVVTVRTADGDTTYHEDRVFVLWDDGVFRPIHREHLRRAAGNKKRASNVRMVMANLGDISMFFNSADNNSGDLVHKATEDLWSLDKDGDSYVLSRLFDDDGEPLKI